MRGMTKRFSAILYHEYMHVIVHFMAGRNVPVWLNEGLAELAGRRIDSTPLTDLTAASEAGRLLEWRDLVKPFCRSCRITRLPGVRTELFPGPVHGRQLWLAQHGRASGEPGKTAGMVGSRYSCLPGVRTGLACHPERMAGRPSLNDITLSCPRTAPLPVKTPRL